MHVVYLGLLIFKKASKQASNIGIYRSLDHESPEVQIHHVTSEYQVEMFHDCDKSLFLLVMTAYSILVCHIYSKGHSVPLKKLERS